jgi:hypothetical protein
MICQSLSIYISTFSAIEPWFVDDFGSSNGTPLDKVYGTRISNSMVATGQTWGTNGPQPEFLVLLFVSNRPSVVVGGQHFVRNMRVSLVVHVTSTSLRGMMRNQKWESGL